MPLALPFKSSIPSFRVGTTLDGVAYLLDVSWNAGSETVPGAWYFDLLLEDETPIASGVKVVLGVFLARRATHPKRPPGYLIASDLAPVNGRETDAGFDDLGARVQVYYYTVEEAEELSA